MRSKIPGKWVLASTGIIVVESWRKNNVTVELLIWKTKTINEGFFYVHHPVI
jgi:hypothetical protein